MAFSVMHCVARTPAAVGKKSNAVRQPRVVSSSPRRVAVSCAAKDELLSLVGDSLASRSEINACILEVEREATPVDLLGTTSLDGEWTMEYIGSLAPGPVPSPTREIALAMYAGGYSPGIFAYEVIGRLPDSVVKVKVCLTRLPLAVVKAVVHGV
eukprot:scaffold2091_cov361-Prasinococcus_capsulatus_cf.AAC.4